MHNYLNQEVLRLVLKLAKAIGPRDYAIHCLICHPIRMFIGLKYAQLHSAAANTGGICCVRYVKLGGTQRSQGPERNTVMQGICSVCHLITSDSELLLRHFAVHYLI